MALAQPGILEPVPAHARYLSCQLRIGAEPQQTLKALGHMTDGRQTVVALGASLVQALNAQVSGLYTFKGI